MRGTVKNFDSKKGYGFITPETGDKDAFVHFASISGTGYKTLTDGQTVEFDVTQGAKGPKAENVKVL